MTQRQELDKVGTQAKILARTAWNAYRKAENLSQEEDNIRTEIADKLDVENGISQEISPEEFPQQKFEKQMQLTDQLSQKVYTAIVFSQMTLEAFILDYGSIVTP